MDLWFTRGLSFLPIFVVVCSYLAFMISYIISVARGDIDPGLPYISDTGARRPESSIFGQMLNIAAAAALATLYVRYKQVHCYLVKLPDEKIRRVSKVNKVAFVFAILICLGMSLVANFQETSVLAVHVLGALMCFGIGTIYEYLQAYITYKMSPEVNGLFIFRVRLVLSILSTICFLTTSIATHFVEFPVKFHWTPEDEGYAAHLTSTIAEWCLAATFLAYFFSFIRDFQVIMMDIEPTILHDNLHHDNNQPDPIHIRPGERTPLIA